MRKLLFAWLTIGLAGAAMAASTITGNVTGPGGGALENIQVSAYRYNGNWYDWENSALTGPSGGYSIPDLPAGTYRVEFSDNAGVYATEWYNNTLDRSDAEELVVGESATVPSINAQLVEATRITGRVTNGAGQPLEDITAWVSLWTGASWLDLFGMGTDTNGDYEITGIPAGTYIVRFENYGGIHAPEYYSNALDRADATELACAAGKTVSGVNAALALAGSISGRVTGPGGTSPLSGIWVQAYRAADGEYVASAETDTNGVYTISGLAAGANVVQFYGSGTYMGEWYSDAATQEEATPINLTEGENRTGINASLGTGGSIAGTVTETGTGTALGGIQVMAYQGPTYSSSRSTTTDGSGHYEVTGLGAGNYKVQFMALDGGHKGEWWSNRVDESTADVIVVAGSAVGNVNAALDKAATISGRVTDAGDVPLDSIMVQAHRRSGSEWTYIRGTWTGTNGLYLIGNLNAGTYVVRFIDYDGDYNAQYYNGVESVDDASQLTVSDGEAVEDIDAKMAPAPANGIAGTVTEDGTGNPVSYCRVGAYAFDGTNWQWVAGTQADNQGAYRIKPLAPGVYRVQFYDNADEYVPEYYNDKATVGEADDVTVVADVLTESIDGSLAALGQTSISGTVTQSGSSTTLDGIHVYLYANYGGWMVIDSTVTSGGGGYTLTGLTPGTYRIGFEDLDNNEYVDEFYDNADSVGTATDIQVDNGDVITGINAALSLAANTGISGTVTEAGTGDPLSGIDVYMYYDNGDGWDGMHFYTTTSTGDGSYRSPGIPAGTYRVKFHDASGVHLDEYYDNAGAITGATDVIVVKDAITPGINAALDLTPQTGISGTVTEDGSGAALSNITVRLYIEVGFVGNWQWRSTTLTAADGTYKFIELTDVWSPYRIGFEDGSGTHIDEFYDNAPSVAAATDIPVVTDQMTTGCNAALTPIAEPVPPKIVGLRRKSTNQWEVLFTAGAGSSCMLQCSSNITSRWDDVGSPTNCVAGTNVLGVTETAAKCFFKVRTGP
jgi:hypothetical protein